MANFRHSTVFQHVVILSIVWVFAWIHYAFFHGGYLGYDELEYARLAALWVDGRFEHDSLYAYRYAGFLPLALSYYVFGAGDFANWLIPALTLLLITWVMLRIAESISWQYKGMAVLLLVTSPLHLLYLEKPMPDYTTEAGVLLCLYSYYLQRFRFEKSRVIQNVAIFLIGFISVFLSKETFLIIYPFFLVLFISDLRNKVRVRYWMLTMISLVLFILIYLSANSLLLGNPLARVEAIFSNRYISECTYEFQPVSVLLQRILYRLWVDMVRMGMLLPLGFAIALLINRKQIIDKEISFWSWTWIILLLLSNFMTISYTGYVPLCHDPRHFLFTLPVGALVWMYGFQQISRFSSATKWVILLALVAQWGISVYFQHENQHYLYLPLLASVLSWGKFTRNWLAYFFIITAFLSVFLQNIRYNLTLNHPGQKALIQKVLKTNDNPKWILTDGANENIGNFYAGYKEKNTFVNFSGYDEKIHKDREVYIILNGMTAYLSNTNWDLVPGFVKTAQDSIPLFFENASGKVYKYK